MKGEVRNEGETTVLLDSAVEPGRTYHYRLVATRRDGSVITFEPIAVTAGVAVSRFELVSVQPSPCRGEAGITFAVAHEAHVRLSVLDIQGRWVALLADGAYRPGRYEVEWRGDEGPRAPAGLYFVRYEWPGDSSTRRLIVTR